MNLDSIRTDLRYAMGQLRRSFAPWDCVSRALDALERIEEQLEMEEAAIQPMTAVWVLIAGLVIGWRLGYGAGHSDGQLDNGPNGEKTFFPWPWS